MITLEKLWKEFMMEPYFVIFRFGDRNDLDQDGLWQANTISYDVIPL